MRKSIFTLAVMLIAALFVTTSCGNKSQKQAQEETQAGQVNNFRIKRGTNISHWLSQSEQRGEARRLHIQEDDFARLKELGFDFVRIPIDEVQFWDEDGKQLRLGSQVRPESHRRPAHHPLALLQCRERGWSGCQHAVYVRGSAGRFAEPVASVVGHAEEPQQRLGGLRIHERARGRRARAVERPCGKGSQGPARIRAPAYARHRFEPLAGTRDDEVSEGARGRQEHHPVVPLLQPHAADALRCMVVAAVCCLQG